MPKGIYNRTREHIEKLKINARSIGLQNKGKKRIRTKAWTENASAAQTGNRNHRWKGDDIGYKGLHDWVFKNFGRPEQCEMCSKDGLKGRQIHWANVSGKYRRDRSDWKRLCARCHHLIRF